MVINFEGNRPTQPKIAMGVQNNNLVDDIVFNIQKQQGDVNLYEYTPKLKIASKNKRYAELTTGFTTEQLIAAGKIKITYKLTNLATREGQVDLQLVFEKPIVGSETPQSWQTQIVTVTFASDINISAEVQTDYPDIIKELTTRTNAAVAASATAVATANDAKSSVTIVNEDNNKQYSYHIKIIGGKPKMIIDEI